MLRTKAESNKEYCKLADRIYHWADKIHVDPSDIRIRHMKRKWASCSTRGMLTLNWDVTDLPEELIDYVIVHELLHLRTPNHGKLWKSFMRAYLGDWEKKEENLKTFAG
ncbi:MAG: hypothetical protein A2283_03780 [Lentisphaerae bacterium RIFOXYA12_FULL_48_11]|nr:MAG: hypothetical protein A2283_03780 [Lentisphaerae bacterium RIFOXYA12_FULL_48_11]